jgi:predicted RNA methylase
MIAAEASLSHARQPGVNAPGREPLRIAELTSGSGLIGLHLLRIERNSTLLGLDLDPSAAAVAAGNAEMLAITRRARFTRADLESRNTENLLVREKAQLIVCNPPYVPEPSSGNLPVEAGAGPDGTAHLMRALELARIVRPRALALSWCSLSNPERVVKEAEKSGYRLNSLFVALIADGEYSGAVGGYLRSLRTAFLNHSPETLAAIAPDGSASFGYLLMSGEFSRVSSSRGRREAAASEQVRTICSRFARRGLASLDSLQTSFPSRVWLMDRWDEVRLRAFLHGEVSTMSAAPA